MLRPEGSWLSPSPCRRNKKQVRGLSVPNPYHCATDASSLDWDIWSTLHLPAKTWRQVEVLRLFRRSTHTHTLKLAFRIGSWSVLDVQKTPNIPPEKKGAQSSWENLQLMQLMRLSEAEFWKFSSDCKRESLIDEINRDHRASNVTRTVDRLLLLKTEIN